MFDRKEIDQSMAPGLLIASPKLDDSPFERAVIVMVHHDERGAMGFIVNKPLEVDFGSLLESAQEPFEREILERCFDIHVHFGGPVRIEQLWVIYDDHGSEFPIAWTENGFDDLEEEGHLRFGEHWVLAASSDSIESFAFGRPHQAFRPYIGYTGWGPGQLENEIEEGSWLLMDFDAELLFHTDPDSSWETALERMGVNPMAFLMMAKSGLA